MPVMTLQSEGSVSAGGSRALALVDTSGVRTGTIVMRCANGSGMTLPCVWTVSIASNTGGTDTYVIDSASFPATSSTTFYASIPFPHGAQATGVGFTGHTGGSVTIEAHLHYLSDA